MGLPLPRLTTWESYGPSQQGKPQARLGRACSFGAATIAVFFGKQTEKLCYSCLSKTTDKQMRSEKLAKKRLVFLFLSYHI